MRTDVWRQDGGILMRQYANAETYRLHQASKLGKANQLKLAGHDERFRTVLTDRISALALPTGAALCLGARTGAEVQALLNLGWFALGLDLATTLSGARFVLAGDMHHVQFPDASVDLVYTNAVDHAWDVGHFVQELRRLVKPSGHVLTEVPDGTVASRPGAYESVAWTDPAVLQPFFHDQGLRLESSADFTVPWSGHSWLWSVVC